MTSWMMSKDDIRNQRERLEYAHWFAQEGYRDHVRRLWWYPLTADLPPLYYIDNAADCMCRDGGIPGTDTLCRYCKGNCQPPKGSVILPTDDPQQF